MAHHQRSEYERNSDDEEVVGDSGSVSRVRRACMATSQDPDEEVEGDSGRIPVYLRMAMEYPDDAGVKAQQTTSSMFGFSTTPASQEQVYSPKPDPWGPQLFDKSKQGAPPPSDPPVYTMPGDPYKGLVFAERFPSTYRLERTNFAVKSHRFQERDESPHSVQALVKALRRSFVQAGIDVVEFRPSECTCKCSYQKGNLFLSFVVTVFLAPSQASGQLLEPYDENEVVLVEVQLMEGDGLYFSGLFRDLVDIVNDEADVEIAGTFRYHPCANHPYGEGLALEDIMMKKPGHGPAPPPAPSGFPTKAGPGGYPGSSPVSAADSNPEELDKDMTEDVMLLSGMIREGYPTIQADAASVVAGLTSTDLFRQQLSMDGASSAAEALACASARLLVETPHRAARRQASVVVANLAVDPVLRAALLASDRCSPSAKGTGSYSSKGSGSYPTSYPTQGAGSYSGGGSSGSAGGGKSPRAQQAQAEVFSRGLLDSLVLFAVGTTTTTTTLGGGGGGGGRIGEEKGGAEEEEEEIGMRRECMRALLGMSESKEARDTAAMKYLLQLKAGPSGQGANDVILVDQLTACQNVLKGHA